MQKGPAITQRQPKAGHLQSLAEMLVRPENGAGNYAPTPAPGFIGDTLAFTRTLEFDASDFAGDFSIIVDRSVDATVQVNNGVEFPVDAGWTLDAGGSLGIYEPFPLDPTYYSLHGSYLVRDASGAQMGVVKTEVYGGVACVSFNPNLTAGDFNIRAVGLGEMYLARFHASAWSIQGSLSASADLANDTALRLAILVKAPAVEVGFCATMVATAPATLGGEYTSYSAFTTDVLDMSGVELIRVPAMAAVLSYTGSTLNDGGVVAAGRWPPDAEYEGAPFTSLTKLAGAYTGPLREGAYTWALPADFSELEFHGLRHRGRGSQLRFAGRFSDPNGSIRVTLHYVVDFYSKLQIFGKKHFPTLTDEYRGLYQSLSMLPAATCNPSHKEILAALKKNASKAISSAARYAMQNPQVIGQLLALL